MRFPGGDISVLNSFVFIWYQYNLHGGIKGGKANFSICYILFFLISQPKDMGSVQLVYPSHVITHKYQRSDELEPRYKETKNIQKYWNLLTHPLQERTLVAS
jgi:hypothetical protein